MIGLLWAAQFASARQFYLMTVEPGSEFWSVYGHTALVIDNQVYGFGVFSFEQEDFYQSFIRNEMTYMVGHTELSDEVYWAETDGRKLTLLPLNLSEEAQDDIMAYLRWHFKPENETYAYDYFLQNCATKIRDLLDRAMSGDLKKISSAQSGSYFAQTFPVENQSLMTFGLALGFLLAQHFYGDVAANKFDGVPEWFSYLALIITALAFGILFKSRAKDTFWIFLSITMAYTGSQLVGLWVGQPFKSLVAVMLVSMVGNVYARISNNPASLMHIPGIILLVPGSMGFNSLSALYTNDTITGVQAAFEAVLVAVAISIGLLVGNLIIPPKKDL